MILYWIFKGGIIRLSNLKFISSVWSMSIDFEKGSELTSWNQSDGQLVKIYSLLIVKAIHGQNRSPWKFKAIQINHPPIIGEKML